MCDIPVLGAAPCQCFSPGANQTTSPGRISSIGPPQRWARPQPDVTMSVWPEWMGVPCRACTGLECHAGPPDARRLGRLE